MKLAIEYLKMLVRVLNNLIYHKNYDIDKLLDVFFRSIILSERPVSSLFAKLSRFKTKV